VVFEAREKADSVLSAARGREDEKIAAGTSPENATAVLKEERSDEDLALSAERHEADVALTVERARKEQTGARLLAAEREETDLRLETERTRADEALTSREDFLAMVSHDLRSLLNGIVMTAGSLKQLAANDLERRAPQCAEVIERFSGRMDRLIGDLIDVARMETGQLSVLPERIDVTTLVRELTQGMAEAATARAIELTSDIASEPMFAQVDAERILGWPRRAARGRGAFHRRGHRRGHRGGQARKDLRTFLPDAPT
jgi:signal transduction histidine kinase